MYDGREPKVLRCENQKDREVSDEVLQEEGPVGKFTMNLKVLLGSTDEDQSYWYVYSRHKDRVEREGLEVNTCELRDDLWKCPTGSP